MQEIANDIIERASQGDLGALEQIYKAASGFVFSVALRVVGNREDAQEVTQEVFLTVYYKLNTFKFQSSFKTWLYRVTANSAINYSKKVSKERNRSVEFDDAVHAVEAQTRIEMDRQEQETRIHKLLQALNPDQRACVVLRNMEGLSYQEIAASLGININTVRSRLKRAREALVAMRNEVMSHDM